MENASKALLIAGAILIAILLIAIGMMVFNSASGVIDTASSGMTDNQKTMHNKKFTVYNGTQSGSVVKDLVEVVRTNNANDDNTDVSIYTVTAAGEDDKNLLSSANSGVIKVNTQYTVTCNMTDGVVTAIKVK